MADIKRNDVPEERTKVTKEKEVTLKEPVATEQMVQVSQGNALLIIVKMLETANKNLTEIIKLLGKNK